MLFFLSLSFMIVVLQQQQQQQVHQRSEALRSKEKPVSHLIDGDEWKQKKKGGCIMSTVPRLMCSECASDFSCLERFDFPQTTDI